MAEDIVITGMGVVSPIGCGVDAFWDALTTGKSGARPVTGLDTSELNRKIACQVVDPIEEGASLGRASQLTIAATREAVSSAGLNADDLKERNTSVIVGTTMGETVFIEEKIEAPPEDWLSPEHMQRIMSGKPGSISGNVQKQFGVKGSAVDLYGACAAGNMAIETAKRQLLDGRCDLAIVGGADGFSILAFIGFMRLRVMSSGVCRPFDVQRDGLLVGEGSAMFVVELESSAKARGAKILARALGGAIAAENYHPTRPHPDGDGLSRAVISAMQDASITANEIDYVCAHGTGTPQNDAIEMKVMEKCLNEGTAFSSLKALTGHTMGAASAIETAACILTLQHQTLIPTWHLEEVLQPCGMDAITNQTRSANVNCVMNNAAGFGGYNSSIVLGKA